MRVLCLIPTPLHGGAERVALNLVEHFHHEHEVQVCFIGPMPKPDEISSLQSQISAKNIFFIYKQSRTNYKYVKNILIITRLAILFWKQKPEVIVSHLTYINVFAYFARKIGGVQSKLLLVEHTSKLPTGIYKTAAKYIWKKEEIIACSSTVRRSIEKLSQTEAKLIYNPILRIGGNNVLRSEYDKDHISLIAVGRLSDEKNYPYLIEVMKLLPREYKLDIFGFGERTILLDLISHENLQDRISLMGHVNHDKLMLLYPQYRCLVVSSDFEGLPSVVIEAASRGVLVVGRKSPGLHEAIELVGGYVPEFDTPEYFAKAVENALSHNANEVPFEGIQHFFDIDFAGHSYCELFNVQK